MNNYFQISDGQEQDARTDHDNFTTIEIPMNWGFWSIPIPGPTPKFFGSFLGDL